MAATALRELVAALTESGVAVELVGDGDPAIGSITEDSRVVSAGALFCALRGTVGDGHDHIESAVASGAVAVLGEEVRTDAVPTLRAANSSIATAHAAAIVHGHPSRAMDLVGVTGTNGKTTIVTLLEHLGRSAGRDARSLGTLTGALTTAAAPAFQATLRGLADDGAELVAAEVSSHALDQHRVDGTTFRVGLFTNLTQDHLDYHVDMDSYFDAKARLFTAGLCDVAIIDTSTDAGRRMAAVATTTVQPIDTSAVQVDAISAGSSTFRWRGHEVQLPLGGRFNISNAVLAAEAAAQLGLDETTIVAGLATAPQVPGRFEWVDAGQPFGVVVDYSHTPASVAAAVDAAQEITSGRVLLVFGAAGDRDPGKRPLMGAAACGADVLYVTSDNPRTEDPDAIINDVLHGIDHPDVNREPDRRVAIHTAVAAARPGDLVVIAGKGHEDYQIIGTTRHDFDDRVVAREALAAAGHPTGEATS